ncbi:cutinase transcription factor 1 beta [Fusarium subglutinans]|uniref:Cutinase transcription factor 1 beta n=1 Tax=Gibberella subglutinans TaxID=42677 RepID=A0A8H5V7M7_GIBSU|nr:cutinase transcription factor 1 beta [Fusarium subglutinans]KAF5614147.1 cutinase transcription factor 1 beta [Fusarium subglutinans]
MIPPRNSLLLVNLFADATGTQSADKRTLTERILPGDTSRDHDSSMPLSARSGIQRIRSRVACQACNKRKVKCDVAGTSPPCSNCQRGGEDCIVLPRKKYRPRQPHTKSTSSPDRDEASHHSATRDAGYNTRSTFEESSVALQSRPVNSLTRSEDNHEKGVGDDPKLPDDSPDTYLGDKRGPRCTVYDICDAVSPQDSLPYQPPKGALHTLHKPHQVEYMRSEGVLTTLPADACDDMIWTYFKHVHFFLPIVDAEGFLNDYHGQGPHKKHDLLFWSMMLAATNFADADLLRRFDFPSRKAMKTAMYERAKCLYDLDRATEKLKLIQSVMLLSFWYTDPQDHTGAWYWIGIAISLAQGIGLHRNPRSSTRARQIHPQEQALRRRIWWSCVVRDRWVSLAKGRPMRIHSEDCDLPFPTSQDVLQELECVADEAKRRFIPADSAALTSLWLRLVRISDVLGGILRLHYRVSGPDPTVDDIDKYAQQIESLSATNSGIMGTPLDWHKVALRRARDAAANTNALLQRLIELDAIEYLKPMIITAIIPAMQIHLSDCKSTKALIRALATHKMQLCTLVLSNLRVTYWSADVMYKLFDRAQKILDKTRASQSSSSDLSDPEPHLAASAQQSTNTGLVEPQAHTSMDNQCQADGLLMTDLNVMPQDTEQLWYSVSPQFSNLDQLLSPGFSLSEDVFQHFFSNSDAGVHGQRVSSMASEPVDDVLYYNIPF